MLWYVVGAVEVFSGGVKSKRCQMRFVYLCVDLGAVLVPFLFSFHPKIRFSNHFRAAFTAISIVAAGFIIWDIAFTALGVWGFNSTYITGYHIANLPVEEVMFFICIPFSCLFTYYTLKKTLFKNAHSGLGQVISAMMGVLLFGLAFVFFDRYYTASTFLLCGMALIAFSLLTRNAMPFLLSFLVLLIPFFITNGVLTGTGLQQPVVWYNNAENLGIRMLTIPIEDTFYGMLLILLNVILFESLSKSKVPDYAA